MRFICVAAARHFPKSSPKPTSFPHGLAPKTPMVCWGRIQPQSSHTINILSLCEIGDVVSRIVEDVCSPFWLDLDISFLSWFPIPSSCFTELWPLNETRSPLSRPKAGGLRASSRIAKTLAPCEVSILFKNPYTFVSRE